MNPELIRDCRFENVALSRGDLTEAEWRVLKGLLPIEREAGKLGRGWLPEDNRNVVNGIEPRLIAKGQTRFDGFGDKSSASMAAA